MKSFIRKKEKELSDQLKKLKSLSESDRLLFSKELNKALLAINSKANYYRKENFRLLAIAQFTIEDGEFSSKDYLRILDNNKLDFYGIQLCEDYENWDRQTLKRNVESLANLLEQNL